MRQWWKRICKEWEKALFWGLLLLCVITLVVWFGGFGDKETPAPTKKEIPTRRTLLTGTAFAFLDEMPPLTLENGNPLAFESGPREKPTRPWQKPEYQAPVKPAETKPAETKPPESKPPETKPAETKPPETKPPPKPVTRIVEYLGTCTTPSGIQVGYLESTDPVAKKKNRQFVQKGAKLSGIQVRDFGKESLELVDAKGRTVKIPFGEKKSVVCE